MDETVELRYGLESGLQHDIAVLAIESFSEIKLYKIVVFRHGEDKPILGMYRSLAASYGGNINMERGEKC